MGLRVERLSGCNVDAAIVHVARLRISVFREWPYLYDGDMAYEENYLAGLAAGKGSTIVAAFDGDAIVGAATGAPLNEHTQDFVPLLAGHGYLPQAVFYCGESVLLPDYRGRGIGHAFFDHREAHARELCERAEYQFTHCAFCSVIRAGNDKRSPPGYQPLDGFWQKRGYHKVEGLVGSYQWRDVGEKCETAKPMQFWLRALH